MNPHGGQETHADRTASRFLAAARQFLHPREFRIRRMQWPQGVAEILEIVSRLPVHGTISRGDHATDEGHADRLLADVGTGLWRLRRKMVEPGTNRPLEGMRRAFRHLESVWDVLAQTGIEIRDHEGEAVPDSGIYALKTLAFQPTPGIARAIVIETVKPSIYRNDRMIQMGEVIVGIPETEEPPPARKGPGN